MKQPLFTGVCTALVTPFLENKINYPMLQQLLRHQMENGIKSVVLSGTTGESATLSDEEKIKMFQVAKSYVGDSCLIIAGTGSNSTAHACSLSVAAQEAGADALLVVSPYYNKATEDGLVAHYMSIAHAVRIPIILYNVPSRTGQDIPVSVYKRLSSIPNIVGVKEAGTDITKITKIRRACGNEFFVWSGNDEMTVPAISLGAQGVISVLSNVCPAQMNTMTQAALAGDFDTAAQLQCALQPLMELMMCQVNPIPVKTAMESIGYDCGGCRLPLTQLSKENKQRINDLLQ